MEPAVQLQIGWNIRALLQHRHQDCAELRDVLPRGVLRRQRGRLTLDHTAHPEQVMHHATERVR